MDNILQYIYDLLVGNGIAIAVGAFVIGQIVKQIEAFDNKWIPLICGVLGGLVAAVTPSIFPGTDLAIKIINGIALGWAATGGVETIKQLKG